MNSLKRQQPANERDPRETRRLKVERAEQLRLVLQKAGLRLDGAVVDMSYSGCAVLLPQTEISPIREFETFDVSFIMGTEELARTRGIVRYMRATKVNGEAFVRVGLEMDPAIPRAGTEERRKKTRYALKEFFQPFAVANHPLFTSETLLFRVLEFSENGLALLTSARNSNLLLGLTLDLRLQNPFAQPINATGVVQNVKPVEGNRLRIGVELTRDTSLLLKEFGDLLLIGSTAVSLKTLKESGLQANSAEQGIAVKPADFRHDRAEILELRARHGLGGDPGLSDPRAFEAQQDQQDANASHFVAKADGEIVGAARLLSGDAEAGKWEAANRGANIPSWLAKKGYMECSRMVFQPDFRSAEIAASFLVQIGRHAAGAGHRYVLVCCDADAARLASRQGYEEIGVFNDALNATEQRVLVLDTQTIPTPKT